MKKFLTFLAGAVLFTGLSLQAADPELTLSGGSGTKEDPYKISTKADVLELAKACNVPSSGTTGANAGHYMHKYFVITADIDMKAAEGEDPFYGIASAPDDYGSANSWKFGGVLDGGNHVISNMVINGLKYDANGKASTSTSKGNSRSYVGFIGALDTCGVVKNLVFDATCKVEGVSGVGMAVGYMINAAYHSSSKTHRHSTIENIKNYGSVKAVSSNAGGIVGYSGGTATKDAGGVYRCFGNEIKNCLNAGKIESCYNYVGGIIGQGDYSVIENCANVGEVLGKSWNSTRADGNQEYIGGIAGEAYYATVTNCVNLGTVYSSKGVAGGIVGVAQCSNSTTSPKPMLIKGCFNAGVVSSPVKGKIGAICGDGKYNSSSQITLEGCSYDGQMVPVGIMNGIQSGIEGVKSYDTKTLVGGTAVEGLSADSYVFANGYYPTLKTFGNIAEIKEIAGNYLIFAEGENVNNFSTTAKAGTTTKLSAASEGYVINAAGTEITVSPAPTAILNGSVTLTSGKYSRVINLITVPSFFEGKGTKEDPYLIKNKTDVLNLAKTCNDPDLQKHYSGVYFKQTADIDMKAADGEEEFLGIAAKRTKATYANSDYYFQGIYDGGNYTIKNMVINGAAFKDGKVVNVSGGSAQYVGFFGALKEGAEISNLNIDGSCHVDAYSYAGSIAGWADAGVKITNCSSAAEIIGYDGYSGGILGFFNNGDKGGEVSNCLFSGSIKSNYQYLGGIVGWNKQTVSNCVNYGSVYVGEIENGTRNKTNTSLTTAGGIAGENDGVISGCLNAGSVFALKGSAGGLVGYNNASNSTKITASINYGVVSSEEPATTGTITGKDKGATASTVVNSYSNVYYDAQLSLYYGLNNIPSFEGVKGLTTEEMTSGKALEGIPAEAVKYVAGSYPVPALIADLPLAKIAAGAYITLGKGVVAKQFSGEASVSKVYDYTVKLGEENKGFKYADGKISTLPVENITDNSVTLSYGGFSRTFDLRILPPVLSGEGTKEKPYLINTAADWNKLAEYADVTFSSFEDCYFEVTADLDFTDLKPGTVGSSDNQFKGIIDGKNKKIKNINVPAAATDNEQASKAALIGCLGEGGKISNLTLDNVKVTGYGFSSLLISELYGSVDNITVEENCELVSLKGKSSTNNGDYAGAIVGRAYPGVSITNCINKANVTGVKYVGGIVSEAGTYNKVASTISNCKNYGNILSTATRTQAGPSSYSYPDANVGGIVGGFCGKVENCENYGNVTSSTGYIKSMGGIVGSLGFAAKDSHSEVVNCLNTGKVENCYGDGGGIVGKTNGSNTTNDNPTIKNCINKGDVTGSNQGVGGILGDAATYFTNIDGCQNYGSVTITGSYEAGGIAGYLGVQNCSVSNSFNAGKISSIGMNGGIVGYTLRRTPIENCMNVGEIETVTGGTTKWWGTGGIIGAGEIVVKNAVNFGSITGLNYGAAGIVGYLLSNSTVDNEKVPMVIQNAYNVGKVKLNQPDSNNADQYGNIVGTYDEKRVIEISNAFYCTETALPVDKKYEGIKHIEVAQLITEKKLGDGFEYLPNCFPMIKTLKDLDIVKVNSAYYTLGDGDFEDDVTSRIALGMPEGAVWTGTGFDVSEGYAYPSVKGDATLTVKVGEYSKTYNFVISAVSAIDDISIEGGEDNAVYYNLQGVKVMEPVEGEVYIKVEGRKASKVLYK